MRTITIWRVVGTISLLATIVFVTGFAYAVGDMLSPRGLLNPPSTGNADEMPANRPEGGYRILALGDSLTLGTGDDQGEGYVKKVVKLLAARTDAPVTLLNNLGIGGLQADQLAETLSANGSYAEALREANLILLAIGGNDLFRSAQGAATAQGMGLALEAEAVEEGLAQLARILDRLHAINPDARIAYVGLYNPFFAIPELRAGSESVLAWNSGAYRLLSRYPRATLVPTQDLFEQTTDRYLSGDRFHPNGAGYAAIADRIAQSVE